MVWLMELCSETALWLALVALLLMLAVALSGASPLSLSGKIMIPSRCRNAATTTFRIKINSGICT